ncbi:hypothetical protein JW613_13235 [Streptomyces smyrnaeus]|uniref:Uncharacterized protein n=1 Tax=Streptomyces smyrnaeus TaxID=1387713 RepID=A0ABS3XV86_9ACTN|nr:hypothetical protein [Streptomyces smyrnaeus]MBO8199254.1 hypothetical protein [Streptomyces smyrnaeus]
MRAKLKSNEVLINDGCIVVAGHPRLIHRYTYHDILDHYPVDLLLKPGTFAGAAALTQERAEGGCTKTQAFWAAAKAEVGPVEGTRMLIRGAVLPAARRRHRRRDRSVDGSSTHQRSSSMGCGMSSHSQD